MGPGRITADARRKDFQASFTRDGYTDAIDNAMMHSNIDKSRYEFTFAHGKASIVVHGDEPEQTTDRIKKAPLGMPIVCNIRRIDIP